jgi:hypothetical protein
VTVADLIAELSKLPAHADVAVALDYPDNMADTEDGPMAYPLVPELECFGLSDVRHEGTWVQLVGAGPYYPMTGNG